MSIRAIGLVLLSVLTALFAPSTSALAQCGGQWSQRFPANSPFYRDLPALVDAPGHGAVYLFGGGLSNFPAPDTYLGDLWKWNGTTWTFLNPVTQPLARYRTAIAYDSLRNRLFMYGGAFNRQGIADAWLFDGTNWTNITSPGTTAPGPRLNHLMVYDSARDRFIMCGGSTSQDPGLNINFSDTWEFNPNNNTWTQLQASSAELPQRLVYDSVRSSPLGYGAPDSGGGVYPASAIYEWTGTTWNKRVIFPQPSPRLNVGWAFDRARGRAVLYAGNEANSFTRQGDTWEFDGNAWTQTQTTATGPGGVARSFVFMVYSTLDAATLHIMASTSSGPSNQTWLYAGSPPSTIAADPGAFNAPACGSVSLITFVNITPGTTGTFQWQRNGVNIVSGPGGASPSGGNVSSAAGPLPPSGNNAPIPFSITNARAGDSGAYRCVITTTCGLVLTSNPAAVTVAGEASIAVPPSNAVVQLHNPASITAAIAIPADASGSFQWRRDGVNIVDGPGGASIGGGTVSGSSGPLPPPGLAVPVTLQIADTQLADAGAYTLVLLGSCGEVVSTPGTLAVTPLPTDDCALAPTLANGTYNFSVDGFGSAGPYEDNRCGGAWGGFGADAWFRYTATCTGTLRISTCDSGFDTALFLYPNAGCPSNPGTILTCADNECGTNADLLYPVTVGDTFLVRVGGYNFDSSQVNLTISCTSPPAFPSDHCADAPFIGVGSYSFSTVGSDTDGLVESGGNAGEGDCALGGGFQIDHDRWFRGLATCTGAISISLCGSDFDTRIMVYEGSACPSQPGTLIACGDNQCTLNARVGGNVRAGEIFLVRVGGANGASGNVQLNIACLSTPPTDSCANAPTLTDGVYDFFTWDTTTDGPDEPGTCNNSWPGCDNDVWFRYTASCTGTATVSLCGSSFDTKMFIYPGTACPTTGGSTIACSDDVCGTASESTIPVAAGQSFLVRVGGMFGDSGAVHMTLSCTPSLACPMDYNRDSSLNLDDLSDYITDFYSTPTIPGGLQPAAPTYADTTIGYGVACPDAPDAESPYEFDALRVFGYRVGFSTDGSNACPASPDQNFPSLDNLSEFITQYYAAFTAGGC